MELGVRVQVDAPADHEGPVVLPGAALLDVVRACPRDELSLELPPGGERRRLVSGPSRFNLRTLPADDFPRTARGGGARVDKRACGCVRRDIGRVARSASRDETRPHHGRSRLRQRRELRMVATDSYRLSVKETALESQVEGSLRGECAGADAAGAGAVARGAGAERS